MAYNQPQQYPPQQQYQQQYQQYPPPAQYDQTRRMQPQRGMSDLIFENQWSNGLCDCCSDCKACCYAFWCMPCFLCSFDSDSRECGCTSFGMMYFLGAGPMPIMMQRAKIRGAYKISGSIVGDFCVVLFCAFCALLQMHNEMKYRGDAR